MTVEKIGEVLGVSPLPCTGPCAGTKTLIDAALTQLQ